MISIDHGWTAELGSVGDAGDVSGEWVSRGTLFSPPLAPLIAQAVLTALALAAAARLAGRRRHRARHPRRHLSRRGPGGALRSHRLRPERRRLLAPPPRRARRSGGADRGGRRGGDHRPGAAASAALAAVGGASYTQRRPRALRLHGKAGPARPRSSSATAVRTPLHTRAGSTTASVDEFGAQQVFMDVDTLEPGVDFVERLHSAVGHGGRRPGRDRPRLARRQEPRRRAAPGRPRGLRPARGRPRPDGRAGRDPGARGRRDDARARSELPPELAPLARRNALTMIDADWRSGLARLVAAFAASSTRCPSRAPRPRPRSRPWPWSPRSRSRLPPPGCPRSRRRSRLAGAAGLLVGTFMQVDSWAHPGGGGDRDGLGYFSSLAPMGLLVGAPARPGSRARAAPGGSRPGSSSASRSPVSPATSRCVGIWPPGRAGQLDVRRAGPRSLSSARCCSSRQRVVRLLAAARRPAAAGSLRCLVIAGAALVVPGTVLPFNDGPMPTQDQRRRRPQRRLGRRRADRCRRAGRRRRVPARPEALGGERRADRPRHVPRAPLRRPLHRLPVVAAGRRQLRRARAASSGSPAARRSSPAGLLRGRARETRRIAMALRLEARGPSARAARRRPRRSRGRIRRSRASTADRLVRREEPPVPATASRGSRRS